MEESFPLCQSLSSIGATTTTAASGGNRESLLGPRPAGCKARTKGRSRCWEPHPGQWHAVRRDGEVYFLLFLYCSGPTPIVSRKTRRKWAAEAKPVCSATLPMLSSVVSRSFCAASMRRALM